MRSRSFRLDRPEPPAAASATLASSATPTASAPALRLGRVTSDLHLDERVVYRPASASPHEIAYYGAARWTEPPAQTLRRMLERGLFEPHQAAALRESALPETPRLEVDLTTLDDILGPPHVARAELLARLSTSAGTLWRATLSVDRPVVPTAGAGDRDAPAAAVDALSAALQAAVDATCDGARQALVAP